MHDDIDGVPLDDSKATGFVASKWEELDPEKVAHQAITTSKWEFDSVRQCPEPPKISAICDYGDSDSESDSEEKRRRLRDIELKICEYQDELENGQRQRKSGFSISEQVENYRRKLLKKVERNDSDSQSTSERYASSSSKRDKNRRSSSSERRTKKLKKSPSSEKEKYYRSKRSRSPSFSSSKSK